MSLGLRTLSSGALLLGAFVVSPASVLLSGNDLPTSSALRSYLESQGHAVTVVSPAAFGTTSLNGFSLVVLDGFSQFSPGTPGNPGLDSDALKAFVAGGATLMVQNPGFGSEALPLYPFGEELSALYTSPPGEDTVRLVGSSPLHNGLTGAALSGWGPSAYGRFQTVGGGWQVIHETDSGSPLTVVRTHGLGRLVYTQLGVAQRLEAVPTDPGARQFATNVVPEPATGLVLGAALPLLRRRRASRG